MRNSLIVLAAVFSVFAAAVLAEAPASLVVGGAIHISGAIASPSDWSADQLKSQFASQIKPIEYQSHGQKHTANAVPLLELLKSAGVAIDLKEDPKADPKTKNAALRMIVVVRGTDGYTVSLSLADILPEIGNHEAWLALDVDGSPLRANETPAKLILPSDVKPGRWVRGIASISVIDPNATKP
jgi:Oxidoreductase molybdopterin binding domain